MGSWGEGRERTRRRAAARRRRRRRSSRKGKTMETNKTESEGNERTVVVEYVHKKDLFIIFARVSIASI